MTNHTNYQNAQHVNLVPQTKLETYKVHLCLPFQKASDRQRIADKLQEIYPSLIIDHSEFYCLGNNQVIMPKCSAWQITAMEMLVRDIVIDLYPRKAI